MKAAGLVVSVAYWLTFAYFCSYLLVTLVPPVQLQPNCFLSQRKVFGTCFPCLLRKIEFRERRPKPKNPKWFTMPTKKNHNVHIQTDSLMSWPWWCCVLHSFPSAYLTIHSLIFTEQHHRHLQREKVKRTLALHHQQFYKISTSLPTPTSCILIEN